MILSLPDSSPDGSEGSGVGGGDQYGNSCAVAVASAGATRCW